MECRVKSPSKPVATWYKDGVPIQEGSLYAFVSADLGDSVYLLQLEIRGPSAGDAGHYRCNIRNDEGETNANLALNFEQEEAEVQETPGRKSPRQRREKDSASPRHGSRPGSPKKQLKSREGTPKKSLKSREGTPKKSIRSRTATPTQEIEKQNGVTGETKTMKAEEGSIKRKSDAALPPTDEKRQKLKSGSPPAQQQAKPVEKAPTTPPAATAETTTTTTAAAESAAATAAAPAEATAPPPSSAPTATTRAAAAKASTATSASDFDIRTNEKTRTSYKRAPVVLEAAKSQVPVVIKAKSVKQDQLQRKVAHEGESVTLECELQCDPSTKITWFKDGRAIDPSPEFQTYFDGQIARLKIPRMTEDKSGLFKCTAKSDYGEAHSSAMVKFEHSEDEFDMLKQQHRKSIMELEKTLKEEEARREIEAKRQKIVEENEDEISTPKTDGIQKSPGVAQESLRSETENKPAARPQVSVEQADDRDADEVSLFTVLYSNCFFFFSSFISLHHFIKII
ncbi:unnamed protein product [Enterobius vermicularis]|uniref:Ig-like domain-containing protein n=1 Tax=Enterobius vermicularis TaxID=51028 RepID=A0A0N4UY12_ENTVE|nr:unnamed protein product [Enterobius vermicularis]